MRKAAFAQGLYYVGSGVWPLVHLPSFEAVTGRKRDRWLVRTTAALIVAIGVTLLVAAVADRPHSRPPAVLGMTSAAALGAADLYYVAKQEIPRAYLVDGAAEMAVIALWIAEGELRTLW